MPTQVFIMTSKAGAPAAEDIEQKLKRRETAVVIPEILNANLKEISKTEVICYDQDVCKQTAQSVINLLKGEGYDVSVPTQRDGSATLFKNRIEVQLAEVKNSNKPILATIQHPSRHSRFLAMAGASRN